MIAPIQYDGRKNPRPETFQCILQAMGRGSIPAMALQFDRLSGV